MPLEKAWDVDSPEDFAELLEAVKAGLQETITTVLIPEGEPQEGEKVPQIKNRRIVDVNPTTWANWLRSDRHKVGAGTEDEIDLVHCYMVGYAGITSVNDDNTTGGKSFRVSFTIDSYYADDIGSDDVNPEKSHGEEIAKMAYAIWMSRVLKRPGMVKKIVEFNETRGFAKMGDSITRESLAQLIVDLDAVPNIRLA